jgi:glutamine synthetase
MVNPYLMGATILAAADDGIDNNLDPGEPEERNIYEAIRAGKQVKKLPMTLGEALEALAEDKVVQRGMPGEMYRLYHQYKQDEWERFNHTVTEWDMDTYLDCLP